LSLSIRSATPADISLIGQFIRDLAEYEKLAHEVRFDEAVMAQKLFGPRPYAEVLIGKIDGTPQGFALFFHNFSTFEGRPGIIWRICSSGPTRAGLGLARRCWVSLRRLRWNAIARGSNGLCSIGTRPRLIFTRRLAHVRWTNGRCTGSMAMP